MATEGRAAVRLAAPTINLASLVHGLDAYSNEGVGGRSGDGASILPRQTIVSGISGDRLEPCRPRLSSLRVPRAAMVARAQTDRGEVKCAPFFATPLRVSRL